MNRRYLELLFGQLLGRRDELKKMQSEAIDDSTESITRHEVMIEVIKHQIDQFEMLIDEYIRFHKNL